MPILISYIEDIKNGLIKSVAVFRVLLNYLKKQVIMEVLLLINLLMPGSFSSRQQRFQLEGQG